MPDYSHPGVYVEEISAPREIAGVPTATTAFVGFATTGPADRPTTVVSIAEYEAVFGAISEAQKLSLGVRDFFVNGGRRAVILRAGADGGRGRADALIGNAKAKTGLHALTRVEECLGLLVVPDAAYLPEKDAARVTKAMASFSEAHGIFHIADIPFAVASKGHDAAVQWSATSLARSRNMAIYNPWLARTAGSRKGKAISLTPPSAIAAGIYARMDHERGGDPARSLGVPAHGVACRRASGEGFEIDASAAEPTET